MPKGRSKNANIIAIVVILRILSAGLIVVDPFWGLIVYLVFDQFDAYFLEYKAGMSWGDYQQLDKKIDLFGMAAMFLVLKNYYPVWFLSVLTVYRLIGQILFAVGRKQNILVYFPNFLSAFFIWFVFFKAFDVNYFLLILTFVFQIIAEIYLHVFWPNYLRRNGQPRMFRPFGVRKKVSW